MEQDKRLIPILLEGVDVIKLIFFKKLRAHLAEKHPDRDSAYTSKLAGAVINELFGTPRPEELDAFVKENAAIIDEEMRGIAAQFEELRIPLTDALRIQFLCESQEGIDSTPVLQRARELGILLVDREVPMPAKFMSLVRRLGEAFGILSPHGQ